MKAKDITVRVLWCKLLVLNIEVDVNFEVLQPYIFPLLIISFFGYRIYKFKVIRKKLPALLKSGAILIDVRSKGEFAGGHNPQSLNIPLEELNKESKNLDKSKTVILCCASGTRSGMAIAILKKNGFKEVMNAGPWTNTLP